MTARILDGLKLRDQIFAELKDEIAGMAASGTRPGLAARWATTRRRAAH